MQGKTGTNIRHKAKGRQVWVIDLNETIKQTDRHERRKAKFWGGTVTKCC